MVNNNIVRLHIAVKYSSFVGIEQSLSVMHRERDEKIHFHHENDVVNDLEIGKLQEKLHQENLRQNTKN